ncbi:Lipoprotein-anchoring transpeptidase ErfK/SrfK [Nakamurella panacisegetis]|uniref:Lipoprotein-anchoring transpeptidase ErfK/SrfK n=1 Tax=Nakamurella panacisegetis TaxID=1090615 RepID=A0A1H0SXB3_9ACTN|nr:Ig-like domain-containing protein [Nakamurella panacisegetis]SDP46512.1 Lipoprotein-anchoring transpeptidase ErfK/SrfK [Nakamurella panacisegetis]
MPRLLRGRLLAAALVLPLLAAACTAGTSAREPATAVTVTADSTAASPTTGSSVSVGVPSSAVGRPSSADPAPSSPSISTPPTSRSAPSIIPGPRVSTVPANGATGVSPTAPVRVTAQNGTFGTVAMTNPDGRAVKGALSADKTSWTSTEPLGYGRSYTLTSVASTATGQSTRTTSRFTTLNPAQTIYPSFFPNPTMKTVGVGQPMVVIFDKPPADKVAAEKALSVKTVPAVKGAWYWWDDRTLHYRAKDYWKSGTKITVSAAVYGVNLGGGAYGETDRTMTVTIGPSKIARVDDRTKKMEVFVNGKLTKTYPVSLGMDKRVTVGGTDISFVTPSGTYVAQEKYVVKQMSSATYGLPVNSSLGYDSKIPLAVRFSNEGIFVHSAPWSVDDQGVRNVSHGCINLPPAGGQWFYDNFGYGDILTVKGTSTQLAPTDGFGDWNLSWDKWLTGSALT